MAELICQTRIWLRAYSYQDPKGLWQWRRMGWV